MNLCKIRKCSRPAAKRGWCHMHYRRWRLYGNVGPVGTSYGDGSYTPMGYRLISVNGKQRFEHRVIMEQLLGRPLTNGEEVHHKDGCPWNNDPSNLVVLAAAAHRAIHSRPHWGPNGKDCASCKKFLPLSEFYTSKGVPTSYCRECHGMRDRASKLRTGRSRLTCADCNKPVSGYGQRCQSCAVKAARPKAQAFCADCQTPITPNKGYTRCSSCARRHLLATRPELIRKKDPVSGQFRPA